MVAVAPGQGLARLWPTVFAGHGHVYDPGQRRSASVSGRGSVSDQRKAARVGGSRERDGRARSARGG